MSTTNATQSQRPTPRIVRGTPCTPPPSWPDAHTQITADLGEPGRALAPDSLQWSTTDDLRLEASQREGLTLEPVISWPVRRSRQAVTQ